MIIITLRYHRLSGSLNIIFMSVHDNNFRRLKEQQVCTCES